MLAIAVHRNRIDTGRQILLVATLVVCVGLRLHLLVTLSGHDWPALIDDFPMLWGAGYRLLKGWSVYQPALAHAELLPLVGHPYAELPVANPPFLIVALSPLSMLSYQVAWWALALSTLTVLAAIPFAVGHTLRAPCWVTLTMASISVFAPASYVLLALNHMEGLLLIPLFLGWRALCAGRCVAASCIWGAAAALKLFPAMLLIPLLSRRYGYVGYWGLVVIVLANGFAAAFVGIDDVRTFVEVVVPGASRYAASPGNLSLSAALYRLGLSGHAAEISFVCWAGMCAWMVYRAGCPDQVLVLGVASAILFSPLGWGYYFVLLLPCFQILASRAQWTRSLNRSLLAGLLISLILCPSILGFFFPDFADGPLSYLPTLGLICLCLVMALDPDLQHFRIDSTGDVAATSGLT